MYVKGVSFQAGLTFINISMLASAGERLAARLRIALFGNLLRQDIAFFDAHKTGELVSRLAGDVQEFKSNFKHCFVNGFRTSLQVSFDTVVVSLLFLSAVIISVVIFSKMVGCVVSLYWISPNMTLMLMLGLPAMALVGTLMAARLRNLSRAAHVQVSGSNALAMFVQISSTLSSFPTMESRFGCYGVSCLERMLQQTHGLCCRIFCCSHMFTRFYARKLFLIVW